MLASEQTNSSPVKKNSPFMETVQDKLKDIKNFSNWSAKEQMIAVGAVGMIFGAMLPILAVALPVAATGAIVALTLFFAYKAVEYTFKGLKWSAEKTVDGAKYTAGKVRDGAVHVKDKVKEGYEHSVDSLKKGASVVGAGVANKFHKASGETDYLDKVKRFAPDEIKKSDEIRNDMKAIFADKGNNSGLVKNILSGISSKIDLKIAEEAKSGWEEYTSEWQVQKEFINNLNEESLHSLLTQRSLPKGSYFIDSVFSEHHDEIKEVIAKCKEDHILKGSLKMRSNMFEEGSAKPSRSLSFSLLGRKNSEQSNSLSRSNSLNSVKTDSTVSSEAELLNPAEHKEVKAPSSFREKMPSWLGGEKAPEEPTYTRYQDHELDEVPSASTESTATVSDSDSQDFATVRRSNSSNSLNASPKLTPVAPPKPPRSPSIDGGRSSPGSSAHSTPTRQGLPSKEQFDKELGEKLAKRRAVLDGVSLEPIIQKVTTV